MLTFRLVVEVKGLSLQAIPILVLWGLKYITTTVLSLWSKAQNDGKADAENPVCAILQTVAPEAPYKRLLLRMIWVRGKKGHRNMSGALSYPMKVRGKFLFCYGKEESHDVGSQILLCTLRQDANKAIDKHPFLFSELMLTGLFSSALNSK